MALRLRRGLDLDRVGVVFAEGELVYTTDTKRLHIGDGVTAGGIPAGDLLGDTSPQLGGTLDLNTHDIVGIGQMSIEGDISSAGTILANTIIGNFKGTFSADDSTILIDGINNKLVLSNNELNDLSDVNLSSLSLSQFLKWSGTEWENNYVTLSDLSDVTIAGAPAVGQVLKYDGAGWVPSDDLTISGLIVGDLKGSVFGDDSTVLVDSVNGRLNLDRNDFADFPNVTIGTLSSGDVLKYNGAIWENTGLSTADLSDVSVTVPSVGDVLTWQGTAWIPGPFSGSLTGDLKGSVFGDDSTVLVDSVRGTLNLSRNELADLFDVDTAAPTNDQVLAWNGIRWTPTSFDAITFTNFNGDVKGSVFGDDSTVLVDGVNNVINLTNNNITDLADVDYINADIGDVLSWNGVRWQAQGSVTADLQGSVFADDSTLLVDGVNAKLGLTNNTVSDIGDVFLDPLNTDDIFTWTGTSWSNRPFSSYPMIYNIKDAADTKVLLDTTAEILSANVNSFSVSATEFVTARLEQRSLDAAPRADAYFVKSTTTPWGGGNTEFARQFFGVSVNSVDEYYWSNSFSEDQLVIIPTPGGVADFGKFTKIWSNGKVMINGDTGISGFDDYAREPDSQLDIYGVMKLTPQTAAPTTPVEGMIAVADRVTWDPAGVGSGASYPVYYDGASWNKMT